MEIEALVHCFRKLTSCHHQTILQLGEARFLGKIIGLTQLIEYADQLQACVVSTHCEPKAKTTPSVSIQRRVSKPRTRDAGPAPIGFPDANLAFGRLPSSSLSQLSLGPRQLDIRLLHRHRSCFVPTGAARDGLSTRSYNQDLESCNHGHYRTWRGTRRRSCAAPRPDHSHGQGQSVAGG